MRRAMTVLMLIGAGAAATPPVWAQANDEDRRPATASFWGDTGLWFVPTAEVVRPRGWSLSLYRTEFDFAQGQTDVSEWPATFAVGAGSRAEIFGAIRVVTRIDRDTRPLFYEEVPTDGGLVNDYPFVRETWTGNDLGDVFLGTKLNLLSEYRNQPFAMALRGTVKVPTADDEAGAGTGKFDYFADLVVSKEISRRVEVTGFSGAAFRGDPSPFSRSDGLRWGLGAAFGARANLRFTTEVFGEYPFDSTVTATPGVLTGSDGSLSPFISELGSDVVTAVGLTWQHSNGLSLGAGVTYRFDNSYSALPSAPDISNDALGVQFRIGIHRGVRTYVPPSPPAVASAPAPLAAPGGDASVPAVPPAPKPAPSAVAGTSSAPAAGRGLITFEDVQFDLDQSTLRPEALAALQRAVNVLKQNPGMRIQIEGHASEEATAEYNLALGARRADTVRDYLVSNGIDAARMQTVSYGELRPKYDNSREETRRLNRRAALVPDGQ